MLFDSGVVTRDAVREADAHATGSGCSTWWSGTAGGGRYNDRGDWARFSVSC
ncbi:hypothetical protein AB0K98_18820 [Streptomyces werraensis]|uniref:hypothetical protein n=1 Tax=Streptomyces werraensis TaxID=68284 RepID=UPI003429E5B4